MDDNNTNSAQDEKMSWIYPVVILVLIVGLIIYFANKKEENDIDEAVSGINEDAGSLTGSVVNTFEPIVEDVFENKVIAPDVPVYELLDPTESPEITIAEEPSPVVNVPAVFSFPTNLLSQLDKGDRGQDVVNLQRFLSGDPELFSSGLITGYYGPITEAAVRKFQEQYGIDSIGRVGPLTLAMINSMIDAGLNPSINDSILSGYSSSAGSVLGASTKDVNAPIISPTVEVSVTRTTASFSWSATELSDSKVMYDNHDHFLIYASNIVKNPVFTTDAQVVLTDLEPGKTYYFVRESVDPSGNIQRSVAEPFTTLQ